MSTQPFPPGLRRWQLAVLVVAVMGFTGFTTVWSNALGMGDRFDRYTALLGAIINPPPDRDTLPTVVVTPRPSASPSPSPTLRPRETPAPSPTPTPTPVRGPVDVAVVDDHDAVFTSQNTTEDCAVAGTQMVLTILGLGERGPEFQAEIGSRIGEWESWEDSHNGGWGPAAVSQALAAYGAPGYEIRAYDSHLEAMRESAIAISETDKPVVWFPWWGAHTWVMTGYRADADPTVFADATVSGAYILDPWHPRTSSIWGFSDPPGNFEDLAELERNWPDGTNLDGWHRPEGAYPNRDGRYVVLIPTIPLQED